MPFEVALLQWGDGTGGVRLLGRSADPGVVDAVRRHLLDQFNDGHEPARTELRVVRPPSDAQGEGS
jgi:hypothetical protein